METSVVRIVTGFLLASVCLFLSTGCGSRKSNSGSTIAPTRRSELTNEVESKPFAKPSGGARETLFERLDAESVGISFVHRWSPRNTYEAQLLKTGFTGGGVCMGDYDGDGRCDVYLTRPHGGGRLFRNLGQFRFEDVTEAAGIDRSADWSTGATFVDVNNDSHVDLFVSAYNSPNRLFVNDGDGTFSEPASSDLNFSGASIKTIFADYDNDGDLDAFLVTNRLEPHGPVKIRYLGSPGNYTVAPEHRELAAVINLPWGEQKFTKAGQFDRLFRNEWAETGKLQFRDVTSDSATGNYHGLDASWWDYDHDGDPDLYVANDFTDPDQWLRNNGDGTFTDVTREVIPNTPWFAMGSSFGDLNNDGLLDMIATDMSGTTHYREKMAMGSMDAVAWFLDASEPRQYMRNALYVNTGTGRFMELAHMAGVSSSDWTWSVKIADLDNDGFEDIYATNGFTRDYLNGDFNEQLKLRGTASDSMAWYDAPELKERNIGFRNLGDLRFQNQSAAWGLDEMGITFGAAFGDLDNDGDMDLITNNFDGPPSVFRNQSAGGNSLTLSLIGTTSNSMGVGALVRARTDSGTRTRYVNHENGYLSSNQPLVHIGLGDARKVKELEIVWPSGNLQRLEDVLVNQHLTVRESASVETSNQPHAKAATIFVREDLADIRHSERAFDDFASQPLLPNRMSQFGPGIATSDVNQDGKPDLFLGGAAGSPGQLWLGTEEGRFEQIDVPDFLQHAECEDMGCLWLDFDGDGDLDLYVTSGGVEVENADSELLRDRVYVNELSQTNKLGFAFAVDVVPNIRSSGSIAASADFDRDGDLDVFVGGRCVPHAYPTNASSQLLQNEGGKFTDATPTLAPELQNIGMVTSAIWSDVDDDGWVDLLLTSDYGPIRLLRNTEGILSDVSAFAGTATLTGWWNSIVAADVDCDGDMDFAVGNLGHNTKYHPSAEKPQYIYYGDFDESGVMHIVEAKPSSDGLLPVRGRSCSSNAMPFLQQKFNTFHDFATSSLTEIYSDKCLDDSFRLEATTTSSGVLINDGSGHFEFRAFPTLAQTAPIFGMQFSNLNHDNLPDLVAVQNFYGPQRETGRMNGGVGCALIGNGDGTFVVQRSDESGIVIPEDAKGLVAVSNAAGGTDLLVSVNNGNVIALKNTAPVENTLLRFVGNQSELVGARVVVKYSDLKEQAFELSAGGGYLSQSSSDSISIGVSQSATPVECFIRLSSGQELKHQIDDVQSELEIIDVPTKK